jgi:hypothetical protein
MPIFIATAACEDRGHCGKSTCCKLRFSTFLAPRFASVYMQPVDKGKERKGKERKGKEKFQHGKVCRIFQRNAFAFSGR